MTRLSLTFACGPYDRTQALRDGTIRVEGVDLTRPLRAVRRRRSSPHRVAQRFWRHVRQIAPDGG